MKIQYFPDTDTLAILLRNAKAIKLTTKPIVSVDRAVKGRSKSPPKFYRYGFNRPLNLIPRHEPLNIDHCHCIPHRN